MNEPEIEVYICRVSESSPYRGTYGKIKNTLKALQGYVEGDIQVVQLTQGLLIICNSDGKIIGLPVNRAITDGQGRVYDVVVGNALVVRVDGEEFASISEEDIPLIEKYFPPVRLIAGNIVKLLSEESLPEGVFEMGMPIDKVAVYRARWPHGTKLCLTADIDDPYTPKRVGDIFVVDFVDDACQIQGSWKSGGSMALIPEQDSFEIVH